MTSRNLQKLQQRQLVSQRRFDPVTYRNGALQLGGNWLRDITEVDVYHVNCVIIFPLRPFYVRPKSNCTTVTKHRVCHISDSQHSTHVYSWKNYTKSPASGAGNVSEPRLMSQVKTVRETVCA